MSNGDVKYRKARKEAFKKLLEAGCSDRELSLLLGAQMKTVRKWKLKIQNDLRAS